MEVDIFIPCFIDQIYPETAWNLIRILEKLGVKTHYNVQQTCCGQMAFNSGFWEEAREAGVKFIQEFNTGRTIVMPSASCAGYIRNYFERLFYNSPWHLENRKLRANVIEFTDFLVNVLKITNLEASFEARITYHDSCAALREYGIQKEPRLLLSQVKGLEIVEMNSPEECCGFGGTFSVKNEPISTAMAQQKIEDALQTGAEYIVSTDLSCLMHLEGYIRQHQIPLKTLHIIDLLATGMGLAAKS